MARTYLHRCLDLFGETMEKRYGRRPDYAGLEHVLDPVRQGTRPFSFRDLETIQHPKYGDFRQFWRFPSEGDIARETGWDPLSRLIQRLPLDEETTLRRLHAAFKYVQSVSVVLRFVRPDQYGIISSPVEKVLEVRRGATEVETYLHYLKDLRDVRDHYGFERAADADMALWVLQERVLLTYRDPDLLAAYRADSWLQERRSLNLLAEMGDMDDPLEMARALADVSRTPAAMLAATEFERRLRAGIGAGRGDDLAVRIDEAARDREPDEAKAWRRALALRDRVGAGGPDPTRAEILYLIEVASALPPVTPGGGS